MADKIKAPIDRPLSRAYLREFSGWSTEYPPGLSDPTSLRVMENVQLNRDGSLRVRPGMRYLSYDVAPLSTPEAPLPTPEVLASATLAAPFRGRDAGSDVTYPNPEGDLGDNDSTTYVEFDTYLPEPEVFVNGVVGYMRNTGSEVDLTGAEHYIRLDWESDNPDVTVSETRFILAGYGYYGGWDKSPPIKTTIGWLYRLDSGSAITSLTTTNTDVSGIEGQAWFHHPDRYTHTTVKLKEFEAVAIAPGSLGVDPPTPGIAYDRPFVGTHEPFYLNDGTKAYLLAVREEDGSVGFRALVLSVNDSTMYPLDHPMIDFQIDQPPEVLNFTVGTTYVKYLQIDNKIFALSDNGEPLRVFTVGLHKTAKALASISRPDWLEVDNLEIVHPDSGWITGLDFSERRNRLHNPSFETNFVDWFAGDMTKLSRPQAPSLAAVTGRRLLQLESKPERTNLAYVVSETVTVPAADTYLWLSGALQGVEAGIRYRLALDIAADAGVSPQCWVRFYGINGAQLGGTAVYEDLTAGGRWESPAMTAPAGAVTARLYLGGENSSAVDATVTFSNVVFCPDGESTAYFDGDSGVDYYWVGTASSSASVYHPAQTVTLTSDKHVAHAGDPLCASIYLGADTTLRSGTIELRVYDRDYQLLDTVVAAAVSEVAGVMTRLSAGTAATPAKGIRGELHLSIPDVARGEYHYVDAAMLETDVEVPGTYFDGSTTDTLTALHEWRYGEHESVSIRRDFTTAITMPPAETPTADTLRATGGRTANTYNFGFFYTFSNEVGESAASRIETYRVQRAWSEWAWETPNAAGEPSGTPTGFPNQCADQLVVYMPEGVFDEAIAEGATSWNLYMLTWSDQDPVPVEGFRVGTKELDADSLWEEKGWIQVTPQRGDLSDAAPLPSQTNRVNYSDPSHAGQGLVAADRMILVNDPTAAAVIRWSSNQMGEYSNFTARKGGGFKTLTSGNLFVPAAVKLWQNPQSIDTLTILCLGTDGMSTAYYMAPAAVSAQSDTTPIMGFEETSATQGTTSPYGCEVLNNNLYHPTETELVKSTAANYRINHSTMTELIANRWYGLRNKDKIVSSQHDNRLYYLVHNPHGDPLELDCWGNEIWVLDTAVEGGAWSRYKIQAHSLRKIEFGGRVYMSVIRHDGVYYLDPEYAYDDYVGSDLVVGSQPIPWKIETNTQGANKAHDAWSHLQQASIMLGNFTGSMRWGVKGRDVNGRDVNVSKITQDNGALPSDALPFDIEDHLQVRRDMKEWHFYAESLPDEHSSGQISLVQYRYAPVSVNVGYEYGSIETFQYTRDVANGAGSYSANGVPLPYADTSRP